MYDKGMVHRDNSAMTYIYFAAVKETPVKKAMLKRFMDSVFRGSTPLMLQLLGTKKVTKEELALLKDLVKKLDKK
jgi:predicted transcriptional regulator